MDNIVSFGSLAIAIIFSLGIWIEALSFPPEAWAAANYRRKLWLIYLFVPPMGLLYLLFVRPHLHKAARRLPD